MVEYDEEIIKQYAQNLYAQSKTITMRHFFIGLFAGVIVFGGVCDALLSSYDGLIISMGAMVGGFMGYGSGQNRTMELRIQAQQALCQVKMEENTRKK
jgi:hypothetical protein